MAAEIDSSCEQVREALAKLSAEDRELFLGEKQSYVKQKLGDCSLLDELCCVRVISKRSSSRAQ